MKVDPLTTTLGSLVIAFLSSFIGHYYGAKNKVKISECKERRIMCSKLLTEKMAHLIEKVDKIEKKIDKITLG